MAEECIQTDELRNLLDKKPNPVAYDGFEPSGRMHIAQVCVVTHGQHGSLQTRSMAQELTLGRPCRES